MKYPITQVETNIKADGTVWVYFARRVDSSDDSRFRWYPLYNWEPLEKRKLRFERGVRAQRYFLERGTDA